VLLREGQRWYGHFVWLQAKDGAVTLMPTQLSMRSGHGSPARCRCSSEKMRGSIEQLELALVDIDEVPAEASLTGNAVRTAGMLLRQQPLEGADSGYDQAALPAGLA
jgi:hypothetical protein